MGDYIGAPVCWETTIFWQLKANWACDCNLASSLHLRSADLLQRAIGVLLAVEELRHLNEVSIEHSSLTYSDNLTYPQYFWIATQGHELSLNLKP